MSPRTTPTRYSRPRTTAIVGSDPRPDAAVSDLDLEVMDAQAFPACPLCHDRHGIAYAGQVIVCLSCGMSRAVP